MKYDFEKIIDRNNTNCFKWDFTAQKFGSKDLIPLWVADMDFMAPDAVIKKLIKRARHGVFGYSFEPDEFYEVFTEWLAKRFDWKIKKEWIINATGIVPAINFAIQCFTEPDDKILVQTPVYFPFFESIKKNKRKVVNSPLILKNSKYEINFKDLKAKLQNNVKIMLLCSPHNPVGRVWTIEELQLIGELCLKNNVLLISDEIHADLILNDNKHIPISSLSSDFQDITISMYAPSKTFNVAGLTTSSIIIPNQQIRNKYQLYLDKLGLHLINTFGIDAFIAAYKEGEEWLDQLLVYLWKNYIFVRDFINNKIPLIKVTEPEGTYLLWLDCREMKLPQKELVDFFVNKARLGLNDGTVFGAGGEGFMRLNIGCSRILLKKALEQLLLAFQ